MQKVRDFLDSFIVEFDWKDIVLFKICMVAFGIMIGACLPKRNKKSVVAVSGSVFLLATITLFCGLVEIDCPLCCKKEKYDFEDEEEDEKGFVMKITAEK